MRITKAVHKNSKARLEYIVSLSRWPVVPKISLFYYDTLDGGRIFLRFLRLSLHVGLTYAKVMTVQKINLTPSSSTPNFFCMLAFLLAPRACRPAACLSAGLLAFVHGACMRACMCVRACVCACVRVGRWVGVRACGWACGCRGWAGGRACGRVLCQSIVVK
jgi:hypothetical protein